jgi:hypothetical protein
MVILCFLQRQNALTFSYVIPDVFCQVLTKLGFSRQVIEVSSLKKAIRQVGAALIYTNGREIR